ncbi:MAG: T9SS type A sorting domain-containing protein [Chitinophagales bacterium]|nr:T9SS type A sorting domain-containing protein [Chitinophagales bacterium]
MKQLILAFSFLFILAITTTQAQNLVFSPSPVEVSGYADPNNPGFEFVAYSTLTNEGSEAITLRWERFFNNIPDPWNIQVCDINLCYEEPVYSNIAEDIGLNAPVTLEPGASTNIDIHVKPKGLAGNGDIRVDITVVGDPDATVVATNTYTFNSLISNINDLDKARLEVYPNPTTDYFQLRGADLVDRVVVYNVIGREMRSFDVQPNKNYAVNDLPNGLYLVSLVSDEEGIMKTFRLGKRSSRP